MPTSHYSIYFHCLFVANCSHNPVVSINPNQMYLFCMPKSDTILYPFLLQGFFEQRRRMCVQLSLRSCSTYGDESLDWRTPEQLAKLSTYILKWPRIFRIENDKKHRSIASRKQKTERLNKIKMMQNVSKTTILTICGGLRTLTTHCWCICAGKLQQLLTSVVLTDVDDLFGV